MKKGRGRGNVGLGETWVSRGPDQDPRDRTMNPQRNVRSSKPSPAVREQNHNLLDSRTKPGGQGAPETGGRSPAVRGQNTFEYIFMLTAALMIVAFVAYFLMNTVFAPQSQQLANQSDQIKDYKKQLQDFGAQATPGPTGSASGPP